MASAIDQARKGNGTVINLIIGLLFTLFADAVFSAETCEVMRKVNGVLTGVQVPCSQVKQHLSPEQQAAHKMQDEERAARQRKCGKDFEALRIGMALDRYEECTEAVDYVTEKVSSAGAVEVYRGMFYYIEARDGRIVAFMRKPH